MDIQEQPTNHIPVHEASDSKAKIVFSVILVIVTFAVMAFAGLKWRSQILEYKFNMNQRDQEISELQQRIKELDETTGTKIKNSTKDGYVTVKEWGVALKATPSGLSYMIEKGEAGTEYLFLTNDTAQSLIDKVKETCPAQNKLGKNHFHLSVVSRYKEKRDESKAFEAFITQIGEYYYYWSASNGSCTSGTAYMDVELATRQELIVSAQSVRSAE